MSPPLFLLARRPALVLALAALGLSQAACASLAQPEDITITAEPVRPPKKEAPPAPAPMPAPAGAAAAPGG